MLAELFLTHTLLVNSKEDLLKIFFRENPASDSNGIWPESESTGNLDFKF